MSEIEFVLGGNRMALSREQVIRALEDTEPDQVRSHAVEVEGRLYPMKQAFALLCNAAGRLADFTTHQARRQLKRLGFRVLRA